MSANLPKYTAERLYGVWVIHKDGKPTKIEAATSKEAGIHLKRLRKLARARAGF